MKIWIHVCCLILLSLVLSDLIGATNGSMEVVLLVLSEEDSSSTDLIVELSMEGIMELPTEVLLELSTEGIV